MSSALRVLVIDDDDGVRKVLESALEEDEGSSGDGTDWEVKTQGFDRVKRVLARFRPDMVVLDLVEGKIPDDRNSGDRSFERIRDNWFCPVVVYTDFADRWIIEVHPQVVLVEKGMDSEEEVLAKLRDFVPVARMIRSVHDDFDARIREALRDSVDALDKQIAETEGRLEGSLSRTVRRQVAARVDLAASAGAELHAWERLVVPPLGDDLLTADLLRLRDADPTEPSAFRLVLTPSCDMVRSGNRTPKADRVLVTLCEPVRRLGKIELEPGEPLSRRQKERLRPVLTQGMAGEQLVIPEFRGHVPLMAANLKRLDLVAWDGIDLRRGGDGARGSEFVRVASMDSPFREMAVWAYLGVTGRPGMPDTDIERWLGEISSYLTADGSA